MYSNRGGTARWATGLAAAMEAALTGISGSQIFYSLTSTSLVYGVFVDSPVAMAHAMAYGLGFHLGLLELFV